MKIFLSKPIVALTLTALAFFYLTAFLGTPPGDIWNSPDETANAFWATKVSEGEPLMVRDFAVGLGAGVVHPRSFQVYGTALVPGSFPGIFLIYGGLGYFTKLPFSVMTPLLTALAGLVLFALFRRLFDERTALWSSLLFFLHPAILYYSGRGLFHNVLFIDLLVFSVGGFTLRPFSKGLGSGEWVDDALAGVLLGFTMLTRASEAPWVFPAAMVFLFFLGSERWRRAGAVVLGGLLPLFILLSFNASTYGSLLGSGYVPPTSGQVADAVVEQTVAASSSVLPFGFHPRLVVLHGMDYGLEIFWWFSIAGILGLTVFLTRWREHDAKRRVYLYATAVIAVWLLIFYGSWFIRDHYDPTRVTIGTSYVRYFLPIYVLTLPWVAKGLLWTAQRLRFPTRRAMIVFLLIFALFSFRVAVTNGDESLLAVRETLRGNLEKRTELMKVIARDGVIMTERFDKVLFPGRMRIIPLMDTLAFQTVPVLLRYMPVYWYGLAPSPEQASLFAENLAQAGLTIQVLDSPVAGESLYRFMISQNEKEEKN